MYARGFRALQQLLETYWQVYLDGKFHAIGPGEGAWVWFSWSRELSVKTHPLTQVVLTLSVKDPPAYAGGSDLEREDPAAYAVVLTLSVKTHPLTQVVLTLYVW
jgi:hypothetical protein